MTDACDHWHRGRPHSYEPRQAIGLASVNLAASGSRMPVVFGPHPPAAPARESSSRPKRLDRRARRSHRWALGLGLITLLGGCRQAGGPSSEAITLGVYSGRHYNSDQLLYERFTQQTGIRVKLLEGKDDALIERVRSEGARSPADLLVLVDAARLVRAADQGLFQAVNSEAIQIGRAHV